MPQSVGHVVIVVLLPLFAMGCAHRGVKSGLTADQLRNAACASAPLSQVDGTVWLKAKSPDATGQFPAQVSMKSGGPLRIEATNLLGGTEAVITVDGEKYRVEAPGKKNESRRLDSGFGTWGGLPLTWAKTLFLGRVPCPDPAERSGEKSTLLADGRLKIEVPASTASGAQSFVYRFRDWRGNPWPEALEWERSGALSARVAFRFDDPDDKTGVPLRWEAKSDRGEVKVRWRDRVVK